jgi:hypothetical protein
MMNLGKNFFVSGTTLLSIGSFTFFPAQYCLMHLPPFSARTQTLFVLLWDVPPDFLSLFFRNCRVTLEAALRASCDIYATRFQRIECLTANVIFPSQ